VQILHFIVRNTIVAFLAFKFYSQIKNESRGNGQILLISTIHMMVITFLANSLNLNQGTRIILSFLFFGILTLAMKKKQETDFKSLLFSFLLSYFLRLLFALLATFTLLLMETENEVFFLIIGLLYPSSFLIGLLRKEAKGASHLTDFSVISKYFSTLNIVLVLGTLLFIFHAFLDFVVYQEILYGLLPSLIFVGIGVALVSGILFLVNLLVKHLGKVETKIHHLEANNYQLENENEELNNRWHEVKEIVMVNSLSLMELENALAEANSKGGANEDLLEKIQKTKSLNSVVGTDLSLSDLKDDLERLEFGNDFVGLKLLLGRFIYEGRMKGIQVIVDNQFYDWHTLKIPESMLIKLLGNFLTNSIKELEKIESQDRIVKIWLYRDNQGYLNIDMADNAKEFPIPILNQLGKRKNSTNGTGNGYFEIFSILDAAEASFKIREASTMKKISIVFDENNNRLIQSSYRTEELLMGLENSILEVI